MDTGAKLPSINTPQTDNANVKQGPSIFITVRELYRLNRLFIAALLKRISN